MIPGKYRSVSGRAANNVNCGLHLVIQTSSLPEKNKHLYLPTFYTLCLKTQHDFSSFDQVGNL
ncbi:LRRC49 isoform 30 [Pan troglodytes]|uniref:Leucine rich repeat containing 49 n=2 Tax=Homininae TaxID=207598 RepID=H0YM43_HUMAN|nr:leucine rich repeat containing 49 [Homo sapiens]PNI74111.1 LRRC49 isoform 26 [Pan troglodytes]KAI2574927.1 leucine rich repeat containing 49 [Homo sapiens]KAI2574928.1 leucine rich repeat containing 49 [Homo sapiens]KAI4058523.1 leucine rich repeat containing 49 [Homo sapiens]